MGRLKSSIVRACSVSAGRQCRKPSGVTGSARAAKGGSSTARGYGYRWQQARARFLVAHPLCAMCSTPLSPVVAEVVDHIIPHGGNDTLFWDETNWQPLCKHCHNSVKQKHEAAARMGRGR